MIMSLSLLLKRHGWVMLAVLVTAASTHLPFVPHVLAQCASIGLFIWFLYRLNVEDRLRKTWNHFQSLPFSLGERAVARIFVPLAFVVLVDVVIGDIAGRGPELLESLTVNLWWYAIFVHVSLVAKTAGRFVLLGLVATFLAAVVQTWVPDYVAFFLLFPFVAWSVVVLSGNRVSFPRIGIPASLVGGCLAAILFWTVGWPKTEDSDQSSSSSYSEETTTKETHQVVDDAGRTWEIENKETRRLVPEERAE